MLNEELNTLNTTSEELSHASETSLSDSKMAANQMQEVDENRPFRAPPNDLVRLVLGEYSIDEISYNNIDFIVSSGLKSLIRTLFPKRESCIYYYMC